MSSFVIKIANSRSYGDAIWNALKIWQDINSSGIYLLAE
jgi:hypothetical protein